MTVNIYYSCNLLMWFKAGWNCAASAMAPRLNPQGPSEVCSDVQRMLIEYDLRAGFTSYVQHQYDRKHSQLKYRKVER